MFSYIYVCALLVCLVPIGTERKIRSRETRVMDEC